MAGKTAPKTVTRTIAQFVGFHGTRRILTTADQNRLVGVASGIGSQDLIWEPGNSKLDVTGEHADVIDYLRSDSEFKVSDVEIAEESTPETAAS